MGKEKPLTNAIEFSFRSALIATAASLSLLACATPNSTPGNPQITANEQAQAARQHPELLAQFGGSYTGPEAAYLSRIGERIAVAAGVPGGCTFTLVNTDVVNAFAVPGCYIYVTRGMFGIVNSEAELASVLAHEVGHVVADHSERRQNRSLLTGLGSLAVGVLTGSGELAQTAGQIGQIHTLGYSRAQEFESDDLGVRYLVKAGYSPYAAADMLESLQDHDRLQALVRNRDEAEAVPSWARTHPLTAERVARAARQAAATGVAVGALPEHEAPFMAEVDGLLYGDDPSQGFIEGRRFAHPQLRIAFDAPAGFQLSNSAQAVLIEGPSGVKGQFSAGALGNGGLDAYAANVLERVLGQPAGAAQIGAVQRTRINGVEAAILPARVQTQQGAVDVFVAAYLAAGGQAYHFVTLAPQAAQAGPALEALFRSFRPLTPAEASALRPRRIEVVTVRAGDTINSLASRMAFSDYRLERFLMLNDRRPDQPLRAGERVKLVVYGG